LIDAREIFSIPNDILKFNETFAQFCTNKFQGIHYITEVENQEIKKQYLVGKGKTSDEINASFSGLEKSLGVKLVKTDAWLDSSEGKYHKGLVVINGIPPANINVKESPETTQAMIAFDQVIETSIRSSSNQKFKIISTIEKANWLVGKKKRTADESTTKRILKIIRLLFLLVMLCVIGFKIYEYYPSGEEISSDNTWSNGITSKIFSIIGDLVKDQTFLFVFGFFIIFLVFVAYYSKYKRKKEINEKNTGEEISDMKVKSAYENHIEELQTWGAVRQSFIICIYDEDKVTLMISLNEIKKAIEGLYQGVVFKVEGKIIYSFNEKRLKIIDTILGWNYLFFQRKFSQVKPFKPTVMSIPRSGRNYFRLLSEGKIPGAKIIEGFTYKIDTRRTKHGMHLGDIFYKVGETQYPYFIKPRDLVRHLFIYGQTGRGKSFFIYNLLAQLVKLYTDIPILICDPKGEYGRLLCEREDTIVFSIGSEVNPIGINIFKITDNIEENKRIVEKLLKDYIVSIKGEHVELSPYMTDVLSNAIDHLYLEPSGQWHMKTFVQKIHNYLDEQTSLKVSWAEKTRLAINARFRELFTGRFESIFCAKESNLTQELFESKKIVIQMDRLLKLQEEDTMRFLVNVLTSIISNYLDGLHDLEHDTPRFVYILDELQKVAPIDSVYRSNIRQYLETARAHRVSIWGIGQNPEEIDRVFRQSGVTVDFGTESTINDKVVFEKDHQRAPEEKQQLTPEQMCFVKLTGERRVILKVANFDTNQILNKEQFEEIIRHRIDYQILRAKHNIIPIANTDLVGSRGKHRADRNLLLIECKNQCNNGQCTGFTFSKHTLQRKKPEELLGFISDENFISFCYREAQNKNDFPCVVIHYLGQLLDKYLIDSTQARQILQAGILYKQLQKELDQKRLLMKEELSVLPKESPYGFDDDEVHKLTDYSIEEFNEYE